MRTSYILYAFASSRSESVTLATVAEIWQSISTARSVGRTTILNHVDRLEKRGWLKRRDDESPLRYVAAQDRAMTTAQLAGRFVDDFFGRSPGDLIVNLLGSGRLKQDDLDQLCRLLDSAAGQTPAKKEEVNMSWLHAELVNAATLVWLLNLALASSLVSGLGLALPEMRQVVFDASAASD